VGFEVDRADCVEDTRRVAALGVSDLAAVSTVMEEVDCAGFGDEPVYCCLEGVSL
jgi:hypothetical protein